LHSMHTHWAESAGTGGATPRVKSKLQNPDSAAALTVETFSCGLGLRKPSFEARVLFLDRRPRPFCLSTTRFEPALFCSPFARQRHSTHTLESTPGKAVRQCQSPLELSTPARSLNRRRAKFGPAVIDSQAQVPDAQTRPGLQKRRRRSVSARTHAHPLQGGPRPFQGATEQNPLKGLAKHSARVRTRHSERHRRTIDTNAACTAGGAVSLV